MQCAPLLVMQLRHLCSAHKRVQQLQADMDSIAAYQGTQQAPCNGLAAARAAAAAELPPVSQVRPQCG